MGLKVMVIGGGGGRESCIGWKLKQSDQVGQIVYTGRNDSVLPFARCAGLKNDDISGIIQLAKREKPDFAIVGPEGPLSAGIVDLLNQQGILVVGPTAQASRLESSKCDTKVMLRELGIPVPEFEIFDDPEKAWDYAKSRPYSVVVKADGLAAGKGSQVCEGAQDAYDAIEEILVEKAFGAAGERVIIEKRLSGRELSFFCYTDGHSILPMEAAQDYKRAQSGDLGKNTGGMGAYSPHPWLDEFLTQQILSEIAQPLIDGLREKYGIVYKGILYLGLMIKSENLQIKPYVLEINIRLGDPEAQVILPRLNNDLVDICESIVFGNLAQHSLAWDPAYHLCLCAVSGRMKDGKKGWVKGYPDRYKIGQLITGLDSLSPETMAFHSGTEQNGDGLWITNGGRVLGVVSRAHTLSNARELAYAEMKKIQFPGMFYRTDIGAC